MGMYAALDLCGLAYLQAPGTSNNEAVVYIQFPRQTLEYKGGDSPDLSVLYSALLEAVGVETAFITIPGHVFLAFSLGIPVEEARRFSHDSQDIIYARDTAWVPVEVTDIRSGFMTAWAEGAREWREFEPVALPGSSPFALPGEDAIVNAFLRQVRQFMDRETTP